jgi:hypothetical protein
MNICSAKLTTCGVTEDGRMLWLNLIDDKGANVSLQLPFDQTQAIAMTLPSLLTRALRALTGKATVRYAFPLDHWSVERSSDCDGLIVTLGTEGGFQVSFSIPTEACRGLGLTLTRAVELNALGEETRAGSQAVRN